jgi:hypothetical protein
MMLFGPLFACPTWAQPATMVEGTTGEAAALAIVRVVDEGSASHCVGGHDS